MLAQLEDQGFCQLRGMFEQQHIASILRAIQPLSKGSSRAGARNLLEKVPTLIDWIRPDILAKAIYPILGANAMLVRTLFFNKTTAINWHVGWHQDRTIAVKQRAEIAGFCGWSVKQGIVHVQAPSAILSQMLICRIHLDSADANNGALEVLPGSHRQGLLKSTQIRARAQTDRVACVAQAGDVLLMRPLLAHASRKSISYQPRRVLHLELANNVLPYPLKWHENMRLSL